MAATTDDGSMFDPKMTMSKLTNKKYLKDRWSTDDPVICVAEGKVEWIRPSSIRSTNGAIVSNRKQPWHIVSEKQEERNYDPIDTSKHVSSYVLAPKSYIKLGSLTPFFQSKKRTPLKICLGDQSELLVPGSLQSMPSCRHEFSVRTMKDSISFVNVSLEHCHTISFINTMGLTCVFLRGNIHSAGAYSLSTNSKIKFREGGEIRHPNTYIVAHTAYTARGNLNSAFETLVACFIFKELGFISDKEANTRITEVVRLCIMNTKMRKDMIEMTAEDVLFDDRIELLEAWPSTMPVPEILQRARKDEIPNHLHNRSQTKRSFIKQILLDIFGLDERGGRVGKNSF